MVRCCCRYTLSSPINSPNPEPCPITVYILEGIIYTRLNPVFDPRHGGKLRCRGHAGEDEAMGDDVALDHAGVQALLGDFLKDNYAVRGRRKDVLFSF